MAKKTSAKKTKKTEEKTSIYQRYLPLICFVALCILIFYPPFVRGLFFKEDVFLYHVFTAAVFILVWIDKIMRRDYSFMKTPLDWAVLAYAGAYLIAVIGAVHPGEAFYGFLRALNYFVIFWLVSQLVKDCKRYETVLQVMLAAGVGVAVIGILAVAGYSHYPGAAINGILYSTLQYSNSTAAYLAAVSIISLTLFLTAEGRLQKVIYLLSAFILIFAVLGTLSKGAWLIFIIGALMLLIGISGVYEKLKLIYIFLLVFAAAAFAYNGFAGSITAEGANLSYLFPGIIITAAGYFVLEGTAFLKEKKGAKTASAILLIILLFGMGGGFFALGQTESGTAYLNQRIVQEIKQLTDFENNSYISRADFWRWGLEIVKDYPVNGVGAGGWNALYHQYQDYLIWTTEAHNHFVQVWVEAGTLGLISFLSMWFLLITAVYRLLKLPGYKKNRHSVMMWGVFSTATAIGMHAFIDFTLSLGAVAIMLWTLFALINAEAQKQDIWQLKTEPRFFINLAAAAVIVLLFLTCGLSYRAAHVYAVRGAENLKLMSEAKEPTERNDYYRKALQYYEKAAALNDLSGEYKADLAYIYALRYNTLREMKGQENVASFALEQTKRTIDEAAKLKKYDPKVRSSLLNTASMTGNLELMLAQAEGILHSNPLDINVYESNLKVLAAAMNYYEKNKSQADVKKTARKMEEVYNLYLSKKAGINPGRRWDGPVFNLNSRSLNYVAKAYFMSGKYEDAKNLLAASFENLLLAEFSDPDFKNTFKEDENWKLTSIKDSGAEDGYALKIRAEKDLTGWPLVLNLAGKVPVYPGTEYILDVRYKVLKYKLNPNADSRATIGIWGWITGSDGSSQNVSFAFYNHEAETDAEWKTARQSLKIPDGFETRRLYIGTGSIGKGSEFLIDYVRLYPVLNQNTDPAILENAAYYAAALYKTGKVKEAEKIAKRLKDSGDSYYQEYVNLVNFTPLN
ncbi:O-antigen ligase family protein [Thermosyntropha sp.]|uniref:O-antigen ligase family protein n=1 Tax=Thermosyntropha sp. TaxID=2740820 RepID=UPI0025CF9556|nr:O-antigen ligase family protein [Thermosyntropha sp.]MBO8159712.1 O-antigen ligase family protein [Thermosyntropha sp.]